LATKKETNPFSAPATPPRRSCWRTWSSSSASLRQTRTGCYDAVKKIRRPRVFGSKTWGQFDTGLPDFSWYNIPKREKYTKWSQNIPKGHKIYQKATKYTKWPQNMYTKGHKIYQVAAKYTKWPQNIPNGHKIYQMAIKYTKWPQNIPNGRKICQHFQLQDPPIFTQIRIFGLKIYHLATLIW
jgi:hypothetical protein